MQYTHLGRSGLKVSRLCLGTMNFGPQTTEEDSFRDHGSCPGTGHQLLGHGGRLRLESRRRLYRADHRTLLRAGRRTARKSRDCHKSLTAAWARRICRTGRTTSDLSALHIRQACDASLKRLQTDYIDLYQMHHIDRGTPWEEIYQAFEDAGAAGQGALLRFQQLRRLAHRAGQ